MSPLFSIETPSQLPTLQPAQHKQHKLLSHICLLDRLSLYVHLSIASLLTLAGRIGSLVTWALLCCKAQGKISTATPTNVLFSATETACEE